ncbi:MAG: NAD-binding protein, partial [Candidatus Binatota bacterium]|nr:NAD-binding protein [Candidatus Binatota bacterium]
MKIIILGAGQVGRTAATHLAREEANEVTVVDTNDDLLRDLQDRLDIRTVVGNGAHPSILEAAGAKSVDVFIALTNSDEVNMAACQIVSALFNKDATRIARIRTTDYVKQEKLFTGDDRAFAVDVTISPEQIVT